jgi:hypothetical protein
MPVIDLPTPVDDTRVARLKIAPQILGKLLLPPEHEVRDVRIGDFGVLELEIVGKDLPEYTDFTKPPEHVTLIMKVARAEDGTRKIYASGSHAPDKEWTL